MKNILNKLIIFLFITLAFPDFGFSQDSVANELTFEVSKVYPPNSITKERWKEAQTLTDLDRWYKASWIKEYISVEVSTSSKGKINKVVTKNDSLHQELRDLINKANIGTDISVSIQYKPNNTLKSNDIKEMAFSFSFAPEGEAQYPGGAQQLRQYLKENAIDKIPNGSFQDYDLTAVKFTITEEGLITDAHVFEEIALSKDKKIDELLLKTLRHMPCWKPAAYSNGTKVKQEFVLLVGNMENCVIPLLNIREY